MTKYLVALLLWLAALAPSFAQGPSQCNVSLADPTYQNGQNRPMSCDTAGHLRTTTTVVANFAGFNPLTTGTPIAVTTGGDTGTLPAGAVVVASNVGTANTAFCKLGASATVDDQPIMPGGWFAFTVGAATQLTCITSTSTTTVNTVGGSGLPTGVGGSGGASGGGTQDVNIVEVGGVPLAYGQAAMAASIPVVIASNQSALPVTGTFWQATQPVSIASLPALPANQSVNVAQINGVTPLMGAGNTGTGSPRVTIATDDLAHAAWGQGATGSAVPAGATYAGVKNSTGLVGNIACNNAVTYDASTNGSTELVALSGSTVIYVCGYTILAAGTVNVSLKTGHGTACATSGANITPAFQLTAQAGVVDGSPYYRGLKTVAADALCLLTSAGVAVQAIVYYTQF